jgi:chromosome segregation ATPase
MASVTDRKSALEFARQIKKLFEHVSQAENVLEQAVVAESELPKIEEAKAAKQKELDEFQIALEKEMTDEQASHKKALEAHEVEKTRLKKALTELESSFSIRREKFDSEIAEREARIKSLKAQEEGAFVAANRAKVAAQKEHQEFMQKLAEEKSESKEEANRLRHILEAFQAQVRAFSPQI